MKLLFESTIDKPIGPVFDFFEDPANLAVIHAAEPGFWVIRHDGSVHPGCRTWFGINVAHVLPVVFGFKHTEYSPPHRFVEEMYHGPFSRFVHIHEFEGNGERTLIRDILEIELPYYYGGEIVMARAVAPVIKKTFADRAATLERIKDRISDSVIVNTTSR
ncbi:MAG TPA: hypothetical protein VGK19_07875 [Capsulimonadaceae bacterium]|jgi:hypothetical protein